MRLVLRVSILIAFISVAVSLAMYFSVICFSDLFQGQKAVEQIILKANPLYLPLIFFQLLQVWFIYVNISFDDKYQVTISNTIIGCFFRTAASYLLTVYFELGIYGALVVEILVKIGLNVYSICLIVLFDPKKFKGARVDKKK